MDVKKKKKTTKERKKERERKNTSINFTSYFLEGLFFFFFANPSMNTMW